MITTLKLFFFLAYVKRKGDTPTGSPWVIRISKRVQTIHGVIFKDSKNITDSTDFCKSMIALMICIDENLTFDVHVSYICVHQSSNVCSLFLNISAF